MAKVTRKQLIQALERLEPPVARAFTEAFLTVRSQVQVQRLAELIAAGDIEGAADLLGIGSAQLAEFSEGLRGVYMAGGRQGMTELPTVTMRIAGRRVRLQARFDIRNERAEAWLRTQSSRLVREIAADQRNLVRLIVSEGTALGQNPRRTALDLVGRLSATGQRQGGVIGLTSQQGQFVANARADLLSGDPARMRAYLGRARRDKRFDRTVLKAIKEGRTLGAADVDKITGRYADKLLQLRGENVARTEALTAFNQAREEAFRQTIDAGGLRPENVRKVWSATGDNRTRESHAALEGAEVGIDEAFTADTGAQLMHPGDTSLGAGAEDVINCRCMAIYRVDQIGQAMNPGGR